MTIKKVQTIQRLTYVCFLCVLAIMASTSAVFAAADASYDSFKRQLSARPDIPWNLEADSVYYDRNTDTYAAEGRAVLSQPGRKIIADTLIMNKADMQVYAKGNVEVYVENDILKSDEIEVDLTNETGTVKMGYIFIRQSNFHINGSNIAKTGPDEYTIDNGVLTACNGPNPDWSFESRLTEITLDGYGYAYDTVFYVGSVPIFYTPFFAFPVKTSRQSGFLMPQAGYSNRFGTYAAIPFFWAIDENQDATFYAQYMTERGLRVGGEYRYEFGSYRGTFQTDYLDDKQTDDGTNRNSNRFGYNDRPRDYPRTNTDRFWIRGVHQQELPYDFRLVVNLDYVSDQDYLREFRSGYMSYRDARRYFEKEYSWNMEGNNEFIRTNKVLVNRIWNASSFNAQTVWYDNILARRNDLDNFTVQQLPSFDFAIRKEKIANLPLFYTLDMGATHLWRQDGPAAQRIDIHPRVYAPINLGLFTLEPSLGIRETYWYQYGNELDTVNYDKNHFNRVMMDSRIRLSSQINKIYDLDAFTFTDVSKIKHMVTPEIIYDYIPGYNQNDLPYYTTLDRVTKRNQVFASLTTSFNTKIRVVPQTATMYELAEDKIGPDNLPSYDIEETIAQPQVKYRYLELLRLNVKQGYDFNSDQDNQNSSLMPLYGSVGFMPIDGLRFFADAAWSFNRDTFVSRNFGIAAWDSRGDRISASWRMNKNYDDPYNISDIFPDSMMSRYYMDKNEYLGTLRNKGDVETFYAAASIKLPYGLSLFGDIEKNMIDNTWVETNVGLRYVEQCWSVEIGYHEERDSGSSIAVFFTLLSIGDIGFF